MIHDEAVRGRPPPPWLGALDGVERVRAYSWGKVPVTPMGRLIGWRITHVVPGGATMTLPASQALVAVNGQVHVTPLIINSLFSACTTAAPPAVNAKPLVVACNGFRPVREQHGNLVARARVVNASRFLVFADVQVEDAEGRSVAHGTMHAALERLEPAPPDPPTEIPRVEEPAYETPDPYLRRYPLDLLDGLMPSEERDGLDLCREALARDFLDPVATVFACRMVAVEAGHVVMTMRASEWLCNAEPVVSRSAVGGFASMIGWWAGATRQRAGTRHAPLDENIRFWRDVPPDGRLLRGEGRTVEHGDVIVANVTVHDADSNLVAGLQGAFARVDAAGASDRTRRKTERILVTLLFMDIVGSTERAGRVGDAAWHATLEAHHAAARREISRYNGIPIDTAGDGFFVRFDSPMRAIEAARAVRTAAARQQLELRAGIHTGECEIDRSGLRGIAVHLAARIQAGAAPGEILVSSTVHDLVSGGEVVLVDRGEHELKGIPGPRRLFAVR